MKATNKIQYPNPFLFHISYMLDGDKFGFMDRGRNSQLFQIGPTTPTHTYSLNANYQESRNLDVKIIPRDY